MAAAIIRDARAVEPVVVVVSAFHGVTNQLIECARLAERGDDAYRVRFDAIARRHRAAVSALVTRRRAQTRKQVDALVAEGRWSPRT